jgi:hypothetical protein
MKKRKIKKGGIKRINSECMTLLYNQRISIASRKIPDRGVTNLRIALFQSIRQEAEVLTGSQ